MPVAIQVSGHYEITNGLVGVRIPTSFPTPLAPIQGLRHRDGTWVAAGAQLHRRSWFDNPPSPPDPLIEATTTVLTNTQEKVVIEVRYTFDRPQLNGPDWSVTAGPGYLKTTITVLDGEPAVMIEEDSDCDVGYSLNVYPGLQPTHARYRGHQASSIEAGRMPDGEVEGDRGVYLPPNQRAACDAVVNLDYSKPKRVSNASDDSTRPPLVLWNPWAVDSGWYWQLYDGEAPATGNLFGIFSGPSSRIIGGQTSGAGIFHGPGQAAGVTVQLHRVTTDWQLMPRNRFSWGLFISTKEDLLNEYEIQPIALAMNRHSGLALKTSGYRIDFSDPTGGYGKLYMGQAAIAALKARVQGDFAEYQRVYNLDSTIRPIIDLWRSDDIPSLQVVVDHVLEVADDLTAALTNGDGIYDRRFHYFEGGQEMIRVALFVDQALAHPLLSPANRLAVKRAARLFASVLWDDDFVPFSGVASVDLGLSNNQGQHQNYRDFYAIYLGADSTWNTRANEAVSRAVSAFDYFVNEHGSPNASTGYIAANLWPVLNVFLQVRELRGQDLFATSPRASLFGEFLINFMTPYESRFGGYRKLVAVGDGSTESSPLHGVLAAGLRPSNTTLAARLQHAWTEMGSPHHGFFGSSLLMIDEAAPRTPTVLGNATFPGYLKVQREKETGLESTVWMLDGHQYSDHRPPDQGVLSLYGLGQPLSISWGSLYSPHVTGALWRSCVQPASQIADWWGQPNLPYEQGNVWWNSTAVPGEFEIPGQTWKRVTKLADVSGRKVLAVRDTSPQPFVWSLNLMAKDQVTPPIGSPFVPPAHPLAPLIGTLPAGVYRWRLKGQRGVDFDLWIVAADPFDWAWDSWTNYWHPGLEQQQFQAATGLPFEEKQYIFRLRSVNSIKWAVIPYPETTPWTGTVIDTPTGLGFTGGIQDVPL